MFTLKIHTVDSPRSLHAAAVLNENLKPEELMSVPHLFRQLSTPEAPALTIANVTARNAVLFVLAVPSYMTSDDFLAFCQNHVAQFTDVIFLRNEEMEDRYSVLISLEDQLAADAFYCVFQGKRFKPPEVEACHIYFVQSVEYTDSAEIAMQPPSGYTELPSCPVCIERLDPESSGIQSTYCIHSFDCSCALKWTYLSCPVCNLSQDKQERPPACSVCGTLKNPWICLICGFVGCGRYEKGHAREHWSHKKHIFSLELDKQEIWDYAGDKYVHRLDQSKSGGKSGVPNLRCSSHKECETCACNEEEGLDSALFTSKIEGILDEYNRLLTSQLDAQRQHYQVLLAKAKNEKESSIEKEVEKAIYSKTEDLEAKLQRYIEEKNAAMIRNKELTKQQELLQAKFKDAEERERLFKHSKDERISDLREQIRDMKVYIETQKMLMKGSESGEIKGGTVLSVGGATVSGSRNPKRLMNSGRRRK